MKKVHKVCRVETMLNGEPLHFVGESMVTPLDDDE
jgi:hypothetical protein